MSCKTEKKLKYLTTHRCYNRAAGRDNPYVGISYVVGRGENRWDCRASGRDERELRRQGLELHRSGVECTDLASLACKAAYALREIQHVEPMDLETAVAEELSRRYPWRYQGIKTEVSPDGEAMEWMNHE